MKRTHSAATDPAKDRQDNPVLLSGGNPQIAKGYGSAPVRAYIEAMPGWKRAVGHQLDALIDAAAPGVLKAVKWNSPFYGMQDGTWFLSFHCFAKYIKIAFLDGVSLEPMPPEPSKSPRVRYLHVQDEKPLDEAQFTEWVRQAAALPGERL